MNKKAFTLVELLAVIVILGVIIAITIPSIQYALRSSKDKLYNVAVNKIKQATKDYVSEYQDEIPGLDTNSVGTITISDLIDKGILEESVKNPKTGADFKDSSTIKITKQTNGTYLIEFSPS